MGGMLLFELVAEIVQYWSLNTYLQMYCLKALYISAKFSSFHSIIKTKMSKCQDGVDRGLK